MRKFFAAILLAMTLCHLPATCQEFALKTNALYWLTTTPNLSVEAGLSRNVTFELFGAYNPWTFKDDKKMKCWVVQPELKLWLCDRWEGHFFGIHAFAAQYFGGFHSKRYDGYLAGAGITYGYDWILSPRWNIEAEIGVGYARLWYKESERIPCEKCHTNEHKNYFGPTRVALSLVYLF